MAKSGSLLRLVIAHSISSPDARFVRFARACGLDWPIVSWSSFAHTARFVGSVARTLLHFAEKHSGVPALVLVAIALVVGYRILKRSARFVAQVCFAAVVVFILTELGVIRF